MEEARDKKNKPKEKDIMKHFRNEIKRENEKWKERKDAETKWR